METRELTREFAWRDSTGMNRKGSPKRSSQTGRPQTPPLIDVGATTPSSIERWSCFRGLDSKASSSAQLSSISPHVRLFAVTLNFGSPNGPPVLWLSICSTLQYGHGYLVLALACLW